MNEKTPAWGIEPVPERLQVLGFLDTFLLWANLSISLLVIGADARVPGMVVLRASLGQRGSYVPTLVNVAQNLGWSIFELVVISTAAAALSDRVFGFRDRWLWAIVFGVVSVGLALLGPIGFVRRYVRKFAVWAVLLSLAYLTWWAIDKSNLHAYWSAHGKGGFP